MSQEWAVAADMSMLVPAVVVIATAAFWSSRVVPKLRVGRGFVWAHYDRFRASSAAAPGCLHYWAGASQ